MKKRKSVFFELAFLFNVFLIVSLVPTTSFAKKKTVKIGFLAPLTGMFAGAGDPMSKGAMLAEKMINEEGGILGRKIELFIRDDEIRPAIAVRMARELNNEEGVRLFCGVISSGVSLALKSVMEDTNSILITGGAHSTKITGKQFSPNIFRITDDARTTNYALADMLHKKFPNIHKWANLSPDYEYGHSCWENFIERFKQIDPEFQVVSSRWPKFGAGGGYGPHINAILSTDAEGLFSVLYGGDMIAFIREGTQYGLFKKIKLFATSHIDWDVPYALKKGMVDIWAREHYFDELYNNKISEKYEAYFKKTYGKKYFNVAQGHATPVFDSLFTYKAAIEKAGSFDIDKIKKALEDLTIDTPQGKKWIRKGDHQAYFSMPFYHIIPDPGSKKGWKVGWRTTIDGKKYIIPVSEALKR